MGGGLVDWRGARIDGGGLVDWGGAIIDGGRPGGLERCEN